MSSQSISKAWEKFKFPTYKVGDLLFSEKHCKVFEVKVVIAKDEYFLVVPEVNRYDEEYFNRIEMLFYKMRLASKTEVLLYG